MSKKKKSSEHYVDNKKLYAEIVLYQKAIRRNKRLKLEKPRIPEYVGTCLMLIANRLATKSNFIGYSFRSEMVSDGIENCILYFDNFNPKKYNNPFAYFTQIIYYAFLRRITKEQKQTYIKQKVMENMVTLEDLDLLGQVDLSNEKMHDIVEKVDSKRQKEKKKRQKKAKANGPSKKN